ncbi:aspartate 1-decarboxylase [Sulfurospirillum sp. 1612]|uniref:aspartate 1-decarboxylase n=1 Tax=Sulfurospirillum sp. 1612 TaxID=3094835 RepID=UPI002F91C403
MTLEMLYGKIHRATVSDANLNYVGSITIDAELMQAAKFRVGQKVEIVNINNGERFSTYIIEGEKGKRDICLNGAAARKAEPGDKIIIIAYASMNEEEIATFKPSIVLVDDDNNINEVRDYI